MKPEVSLILPCRNEEHFIEKVIDDLLAQDYPKELIEILIADGQSEDQTRNIIQKKAHSHNKLYLIDNPNRTVPYGLNKAIEMAKGELIIRIDAHCEYPKNYVSRLVSIHEKEQADNVGGICETLPGDDSFIAYAISIAMSTGFGVGNSYFRIGADKITEVDTVPFGCFSRSLFEKIGFFDEELVRNQDDEFNARIINSGGKILLIPDLKIKYYARPNLSKMTRMFYQYGLFKPLVNNKIGSPATSRQLVPPLFTSYLLFGWPVCFINQMLAGLYLFGLCTYFMINLFISSKVAFKKGKPALLFFLPLVFLLIHISYGWGYIKGLLKFRYRRQRVTSTELNENR